MPLSQTGSYTNEIRCRCPRHCLTHNHILIPMSQMWSYIVTRSKQICKHRSQAYTHLAKNIYSSQNSF
ncbi:Protein NLP5 -like protein [Gossypium arboreum]|uniref:Protein NLP5-like protein n=1 Tax=Gossypium arboreum TaxID=29729 RepID=A0A0B0PJ75_GOSAR|nr:Protein NLP5 -like protein [Gossypium arboreum]